MNPNNFNYPNIQNYPSNQANMPYSYQQPGNINGTNNDRVGGFLFPFLLGGITGGVLSPYFRPNNYYPTYPPYYYGPYPRYY